MTKKKRHRNHEIRFNLPVGIGNPLLLSAVLGDIRNKIQSTLAIFKMTSFDQQIAVYSNIRYGGSTGRVPTTTTKGKH